MDWPTFRDALKTSLTKTIPPTQEAAPYAVRGATSSAAPAPVRPNIPGGMARPPLTSFPSPIADPVYAPPHAIGGGVAPEMSVSRFNDFLGNGGQAWRPRATVGAPAFTDVFPQSTPRSMPALSGGAVTPSAAHSYLQSGGVLPPEAPKSTIDMSAMRGAPASTVGYSMGQASSTPRGAGAPYSVGDYSGTMNEARGLARAAGAIGAVAKGSPMLALGSVAAPAMYREAGDPSSEFGGTLNGVNAAIQREPTFAGKVGAAAKGLPWVIGTAQKAALRPFHDFLAGAVGGDGAPPITLDSQSHAFSRAPTNMAEYKQMMALKDASQPASSAPAKVMSNDVYAPRATPAAPTTQSYNDWVMKQPVSRLNAADYAERVNLETAKRAPELAQQNFLKAASYSMSHPDMVTSEEHHKDGSWAKTYGDRSAHAMQTYGTFRDALAKNDVEGIKAQAALERAQNSEKFTAGDKLNMVDAAQKRVVDALFANGSPQINLQHARAYFPTYAAALKANGMEPPDFDTFLQEQYGVTKNVGGYYNAPK